MLDTFNFCVYYITCVREKPNEQHNIICASGSVVEHLLAKEGVAGSIPVSRSQENKTGYPNGYPVLFFRVQSWTRRFEPSTLRFGRRKTKVHRTLCDVREGLSISPKTKVSSLPLIFLVHRHEPGHLAGSRC